MVMHVSNGRNEYHQGLARYHPRVHQNPTKNPGETVTINWPVSNQGDATGKAQMLLTSFTTGGSVAQTAEIPIIAGGSVVIQLQWTITTQHGTGPHLFIIQMFDKSAGLFTPLATHQFTLTVGTGGPLLVAADPIIS